MKFPDFFAEAPTITLRDPLAAFLGASEGGVMSYAYIDVVKLAGHSCPTVAGTYLMVRSGLRHLYDDEIPERGSIEVHMRSPRDKGVTGVMAAVATLITGARRRQALAVSARMAVLRGAISYILTRRSMAFWPCGDAITAACPSSGFLRQMAA